MHELEKVGAVDGPEYLEAHAKHEALCDAHVEAKAKKILKWEPKVKLADGLTDTIAYFRTKV